MSLLKTLAEKPWLPPMAGAGFAPPHGLIPSAAGRTALKFFIAVASVIFFLLTITFLSRTQYPDFQALAGEPWQPFSNTSQLWLNTAILLLASIALRWGVVSSRQQNLGQITIALVAASLFSMMFLFAQFAVWQQLYSLGYFVSSNPANSYFYLFTGIHGLHLLGGLVALARCTVLFTTRRDCTQLNRGLALCRSYWDFLLLIWLFLFLLLTLSSASYRAIAVLCGF
ncbi:cytochrome c oxidase subunit III [Gammaproteobacteria bacterium 53_120_T64]|nr:cytochrome c oxidase subunit III [Gammaproteobacteria bacterium 53_120_T64]